MFKVDWQYAKTSIACTNIYVRQSVVRVLPHVMRNVNELNIPSGDSHGYEILYFGVNLILMFDYRLSFNIEVKTSDHRDGIDVLIISRRAVSAWKNNDGKDNSSTEHIKIHYSNNGQKINDIFKPSVSDAYAFILSDRSSPNNNIKYKTKTVKVTLTHSWQQEIKESQLKNRSS
jgi:hypothetical protein